jgi:hypothetical protein
LRRLEYGDADADRGSSLGGGSVGRAIAALASDDESPRANVARWFFESVGGNTPEQSWATRETLDEGLDTIRTLVRDWIVAGLAGQDAPAPISIDYAARLRQLPPLAAGAAVELLAKLDGAARLARTNVKPEMVGEIVRMELTRATATKSA